MIPATTLTAAELGRLTDQVVYTVADSGAIIPAKVVRANLSGARVNFERENPDDRPDQDRFSALSVIVPLWSCFLTRGNMKAVRDLVADVMDAETVAALEAGGAS